MSDFEDLDFWLVSVAIPRPVEGLFTYRLPTAYFESAQIGAWALVPFGRGKTHAYLVEKPVLAKEFVKKNPNFDLKKLKTVEFVSCEPLAFDSQILEVCRFVSDYYESPLGEVLGIATPTATLGLRSSKKGARDFKKSEITAQFNELTTDQKLAAQQIWESSLPVLLEGVTGSGKTEVYLDVARRTLAEGKSVLVLVPEIALTPQLHRRFEQSLGVSVGLWHSALSPGKRRDVMAWLQSGELRAVVGARSAIFAPLKNLGLIVVDEEHDPTYKQEDRVRYNARDLALVRAKVASARVIMGSGTPSLESLEKVRDGKFTKAILAQRYQPQKVSFEIIDLKEELCVEGLQCLLAEKTRAEIEATLQRDEQVLIFLNRRGFASFLLCEDCGHVWDCDHCSVSVTVHRKARRLKCHWCGDEKPIPDGCAKCGGLNLIEQGAGTESLELELPKAIPSMRPVRLDRDQVTSHSRLSETLDEFHSGRANTLIGTQMLVKGHDFSRVGLVVVMLADGLLKWPDYRASERALQVLAQVAGRAGRRGQDSRVLVQTFDPDHPVLKVLCGLESRDQFLEKEREIRKELGYPPFSRLAKIRVESTNGDLVREVAQKIATGLESTNPEENLIVMGPSPPLIERIGGIHREQVILKSPSLRTLHLALSRVRQASLPKNVEAVIDVDPGSVE